MDTKTTGMVTSVPTLTDTPALEEQIDFNSAQTLFMLVIPLVLPVLFFWYSSRKKVIGKNKKWSYIIASILTLDYIFYLYVWGSCIGRGYCGYEEPLVTQFIIIPIGVIAVLIWVVRTMVGWRE